MKYKRALLVILLTAVTAPMSRVLCKDSSTYLPGKKADSNWQKWECSQDELFKKLYCTHQALVYLVKINDRLYPHTPFKAHRACHRGKLPISSKEIESCVALMSKAESVQPLLQLVSSFEKSDMKIDKTYLKEIVLAIIETLSTVLENYNGKKGVKIKKLLDKLVDLVERIDDVPVEEALTIINLVGGKLPKIIEKYKLKSKLTWKRLFKRYWWVSPVVSSSFITTLVVRHTLFRKQTA